MPSGVEVILLTREDCRYCHDAEEILTRLSAEFALQLVMVDLDTREGNGLAIAGGVLFPPGILIDGEPFSYGRPSERKLRKRLETLIAGSAEVTLCPRASHLLGDGRHRGRG